jgi:hypothetical protein
MSGFSATVRFGRRFHLLVDGADAELLRMGRALGVHGLAVQEDVASIPAIGAREALDESGLAGPVLAEEGVDLAGRELEAHAIKGERAGNL